MEREEYFDCLRENNYKLTPKRKAVIDLLLNERKIFSANEIWIQLKNKFEELGLPTVYRILQQFYRINIVSTITTDKNESNYFLCLKPGAEHHYHFICKKCKKVLYLDYCDISDIKKAAIKQLNAKVEKHYLCFEGLCSECLFKKK